ncbi:MAG TPA: fatty acid desaturase [Polyangiaceae bacterium]
MTTCSDGAIRWAPQKTAWFVLMLLPSLLWFRSALRVDVVIASVALTVLTVCVGHSVGLHRGVIHRTYRMGPRTRAVLLVLAALAGIAGPLTLMRVHRIRDYWQNRADCPRFYRYEHGLLRDFWWNLHCLHVPPAHAPDPSDALAGLDRGGVVVVNALEWLWRPLQLTVAVPAYLAFGLGGAVGCVCARVTIAMIMHELVGWFAHAHSSGYRNYSIAGAVEEGRNSLLFGAISFGEGWHNNHHACPGSARFGVRPWELDIGWLVLRALAFVGLVHDVQTHRTAALKEGARPLA